jgi:hypothetical protein
MQTSRESACASVCQLYASAGESGLVRVRTGCAKIAYLCGLSDPLGRVWTTVFLLVMSLGQRFESARRLLVALDRQIMSDASA